MANYTENYQLEKPLPEEFYDVGVQNSNWDKIDAAIAAIDGAKAGEKGDLADDDALPLVDSADSSKTKRVLWSTVKTALANLFVPLTRKVNGKALSEDLTLTGEDIKVSGSDETSISSSLANKVDVSPGYANDQFGNDLNNWFRAGFYQTIGGRTTNVPPGCDGWGLITIVNAMATSDTWTVQFFQPSNSVGSLGVPLFYRYWNTSWSKWEPIAIATPPEEHAIVPKNGASLRPGYKNSYSKDQYGRIIVNFAFTFTYFPSNGVVLFSLPQEFLPKDTVDAVAWGYDSDNKSYCCDIAITSDGNAALYHDIPNDKNIQSIHGTVVF